MGFIMRFVTEYLKYLSLAIFGLFILIYSPIIQADEINEVTVDEIILDWVNLNGKTVMISGHLFFVFDDDTSDISVDWEDLVISQYKMYGTPLFVNASKISNKQKRWVTSNCEFDIGAGGCHVYLTGVFNHPLIDAIEIKKMGMKDKLTNIAVGKKNQLKFMSSAIDFENIKLKLKGSKDALDTIWAD